MKDNLEKFIQENRQAFDDLEPSEGLWKDIEGKVAKSKKDFSWIWKVAAVLLLCSTLALLIDRQFVTENNQMSDISPLMTELMEVEGHYTTVIQTRSAEISKLIADKQLEDVQILEDLEALNQMYEELKEELDKNQNDERVINAMIRNLQLRVEILTVQLENLKKLKGKEDYEIIS